MKKLSYSSLGTTCKRKESKLDHNILQKLYDDEWLITRDFCTKSKEEINLWQFNRIRELVKHAFETVPLYNKKYSAIGFYPEDLKSWQDFENLPILTKEELIDAFPNDFLSSKHSLEFTTRSSGSSGKFVTVAVSPYAIYRDTLQGARQLYFQSDRKATEKDKTVFIYTDAWWVSSINGKFPLSFIPTNTKVDDTIKKLKTINPEFLSLYPTYLDMIRENNVNLAEIGIELIIVHSEQSTRNHRKELSDFFKIPILDEFSSEELTRIALECPNHQYHLEEDACYIEIVDSVNKKLQKKGEDGLIIGTNLLNEATPIIRYHQGDIAGMKSDSYCDCGSNFRLISEPKGRLMDSIKTSYGKLVPASCFMDLAYNWFLQSEIPVHGMKYQIVQNEDLSINLYVVPGQYVIGTSQLNQMKQSMYQLLPKDIIINAQLIDKIPNNNGTKYRPVISKVIK